MYTKTSAHFTFAKSSHAGYINPISLLPVHKDRGSLAVTDEIGCLQILHDVTPKDKAESAHPFLLGIPKMNLNSYLVKTGMSCLSRANSV